MTAPAALPWQELIERLEAAEGEDGWLSEDIAKAVGIWSLTAGRFPTYPGYTGSLDAALTLVPEGYIYLIRQGHPDLPDGSGRTLHFANVIPVVDFRNDHRAYANTPALALCIASLKARAKGPQA